MQRKVGDDKNRKGNDLAALSREEQLEVIEAAMSKESAWHKAFFLTGGKSSPLLSTDEAFLFSHKIDGTTAFSVTPSPTFVSLKDIMKSPFNANVSLWSNFLASVPLVWPPNHHRRACLLAASPMLTDSVLFDCEQLMASYATLVVVADSAAFAAKAVCHFSNAVFTTSLAALHLLDRIREHIEMLACNSTNETPTGMSFSSSSQPTPLKSAGRQLSAVTSAEFSLFKRLLGNITQCCKIVLESISNRERLQSVIRAIAGEDGGDASSSSLLSSVESLMCVLILEKVVMTEPSPSLTNQTAVQITSFSSPQPPSQFKAQTAMASPHSSTAGGSAKSTPLSLLDGAFGDRDIAATNSRTIGLKSCRDDEEACDGKCQSFIRSAIQKNVFISMNQSFPSDVQIERLAARLRNACRRIIAFQKNAYSPSTDALPPTMPLSSTVAALLNNYATCAHALFAASGSLLLDRNGKREVLEKPSSLKTGVRYTMVNNTAGTVGTVGGGNTPSAATAIASPTPLRSGGGDPVMGPQMTIEEQFIASAPAIVMTIFDPVPVVEDSTENCQKWAAARTIRADISAGCGLFRTVLEVFSVYSPFLVVVPAAGGGGGSASATRTRPADDEPSSKAICREDDTSEEDVAALSQTVNWLRLKALRPNVATQPTSSPAQDPLLSLATRLTTSSTILERLFFIVAMDEKDMNGCIVKAAEGERENKADALSVLKSMASALTLAWGRSLCIDSDIEATDSSSIAESVAKTVTVAPPRRLRCVVRQLAERTHDAAAGSGHGSSKPATSPFADLYNFVHHGSCNAPPPSATSAGNQDCGAAVLAAVIRLAGCIGVPVKNKPFVVNDAVTLRRLILSILKRIIRESVLPAVFNNDGGRIFMASGGYVEFGTTERTTHATPSKNRVGGCFTHSHVLALALIIRTASALYSAAEESPQCNHDDTQRNSNDFVSPSETAGWFSKHCAPLLVTILQPIVRQISGHGGARSTTDAFFAAPPPPPPTLPQQNTVAPPPSSLSSSSTFGKGPSAEAIKFALAHARREYTLVLQPTLVALTAFIASKGFGGGGGGVSPTASLAVTSSALAAAASSSVMLLRVFYEVARELRAAEAAKGMADSVVWCDAMLPLMALVCAVWVRDHDPTATKTIDGESTMERSMSLQHPLWLQNKAACRVWFNRVATLLSTASALSSTSILSLMVLKYLRPLLLSSSSSSFDDQRLIYPRNRLTSFYDGNEILRRGINNALRATNIRRTFASSVLLDSHDTETERDLNVHPRAMILSFQVVVAKDGRRGLLLSRKQADANRLDGRRASAEFLLLPMQRGVVDGGRGYSALSLLSESFSSDILATIIAEIDAITLEMTALPTTTSGAIEYCANNNNDSSVMAANQSLSQTPIPQKMFRNADKNLLMTTSRERAVSPATGAPLSNGTFSSLSPPPTPQQQSTTVPRLPPQTPVLSSKFATPRPLPLSPSAYSPPPSLAPPTNPSPAAAAVKEEVNNKWLLYDACIGKACDKLFDVSCGGLVRRVCDVQGFQMTPQSVMGGISSNHVRSSVTEASLFASIGELAFLAPYFDTKLAAFIEFRAETIADNLVETVLASRQQGEERKRELNKKQPFAAVNCINLDGSDDDDDKFDAFLLQDSDQNEAIEHREKEQQVQRILARFFTLLLSAVPYLSQTARRHMFESTPSKPHGCSGYGGGRYSGGGKGFPLKLLESVIAVAFGEDVQQQEDNEAAGGYGTTLRERNFCDEQTPSRSISPQPQRHATLSTVKRTPFSSPPPSLFKFNNGTATKATPQRKSHAKSKRDLDNAEQSSQLSPLQFDPVSGEFVTVQTQASQVDLLSQTEGEEDTTTAIAEGKEIDTSLFPVSRPIYEEIKAAVTAAMRAARAFALSSLTDCTFSSAGDFDNADGVEPLLQSLLLDGLLAACKSSPDKGTEAKCNGAEAINDLLALPRQHLFLDFGACPALEKIPWESIDVCWGQSVTRVPSSEWLRRGEGEETHHHNLLPLSIAPIATSRFSYLLDPEGNLPSTRRRFTEFFTSKHLSALGVVGPIVESASPSPSSASTNLSYTERWLGEVMPALGERQEAPLAALTEAKSAEEPTTSLVTPQVGLFAFIGHGHGKALLPPSRIAAVVGQVALNKDTQRPSLRAPTAPVVALMGCASAKLTSLPLSVDQPLSFSHSFSASSSDTVMTSSSIARDVVSFVSVPASAPTSVPRAYLALGSPAVVGCLWTVSDRQIDKLTIAMLNGVYPDSAATHSRKSNSPLRSGPSPATMTSSSSSTTSSCSSLAAALALARRKAKLRYGIGGCTVMYGLPMFTREGLLWKAKPAASTSAETEKKATGAGAAGEESMLPLDEQVADLEANAPCDGLYPSTFGQQEDKFETQNDKKEEDSVNDLPPPQIRGTIGPNDGVGGISAAAAWTFSSGSLISHSFVSSSAAPLQHTTISGDLMFGDEEEEAAGRPTIAFEPQVPPPAAVQQPTNVIASTLAVDSNQIFIVGNKRAVREDEDVEAAPNKITRSEINIDPDLSKNKRRTSPAGFSAAKKKRTATASKTSPAVSVCESDDDDFSLGALLSQSVLKAPPPLSCASCSKNGKGCDDESDDNVSLSALNSLQNRPIRTPLYFRSGNTTNSAQQPSTRSLSPSATNTKGEPCQQTAVRCCGATRRLRLAEVPAED